MTHHWVENSPSISFNDTTHLCLQRLSKSQNDLKQNDAQENAPFSGTVFHALSHGVICFVASVSSKNHLLTGWNSLTANQGASIQWFLKLTLTTKRSKPCERAWKTVPENVSFPCVLLRCACWIFFTERESYGFLKIKLKVKIGHTATSTDGRTLRGKNDKA